MLTGDTSLNKNVDRSNMPCEVRSSEKGMGLRGSATGRNDQEHEFLRYEYFKELFRLPEICLGSMKETV
jgi:hypothetical protein